MPPSYLTTCNTVFEWGYTSGKVYSDPFNEVTLDVVITAPDGTESVIPAFWAGGQAWGVRFAASQAGRYSFCTVCSDPANAALHEQRGTVVVDPYLGSNPLLKHGPLRVSKDRNYFEHADGMPFFWLGDTWWLGFTSRLKWPDEFAQLIDDRKAKGFTLIQLVAGLYPDMAPFDPRGANAGGFAWEADFARINPAFFDHVDLKLRHLVRNGLVPLLVAAWGYYLPIMGVDKMQQHWRYLVARYGAYPVVWCLAGETLMNAYQFNLPPLKRQQKMNWNRLKWSEVAQYLRQIDPYHRPLTTHPMAFSHSALEVEDINLLDFSMIQTAHGGQSLAVTAAQKVSEFAATSPLRPLVNGEGFYEGILGGAWEDLQRFCFWSSMLSGTTGYTYGANGLWQVNRVDDPYGPSPHGMSWGVLNWEQAYRLPGSAQLGLAKDLLLRYSWWRLTPHPEWVETRPEAALQSYAAGIPGELRMIYFPSPLFPWETPARILALEPGINYLAYFFNPITGDTYAAGYARANAEGAWVVPQPPVGQDLVLVLEKTR